MGDNSTNNLTIDLSQPNVRLNHHAKDIEKVLRHAVREALLMHGRAGNPVAMWRDDKVVWLEAGEVLNELGEETGKRNA